MRADLRLLLRKASKNIKRKLELDKMGGHILEAAGSTFFFGIEKLFFCEEVLLWDSWMI